MKAARIHRFGPPDVIAVEDMPDPVPGPGEILVRVAVAGCGSWDALVRRGESELAPPLPFVLGAEFAGVVEAVGEGVTDPAPGTPVFGATNGSSTGAYAERAVASAAMVAPRPARLAPVDAASVPVIAVTAWQMLFEQARLAVGQTVLVLGAAGNVGAYAVQLARRQGAHVVAVGRAGDAAELRQLGASRIIDGGPHELEATAGAVDVVIDTVGGTLQQRAFLTLRRGGILVSCVSPPDKDEAQRRGVRTAFGIVRVDRADLVSLGDLIAGGSLRARVGAVLPLDEARRAHEMLEGLRPRPRGKIVLAVPG